MRITVLDGYTLNPGDLSWEAIASLGTLKVYDRSAPEEIIPRSRDSEIILTNKTPLSQETISSLPRLRHITVLATGYNVVDLEAARKQNISVSNIPAYSTPSVAQMVFALLLALTNRVQEHSDAVHSGAWETSADFCFWNSRQIELAGKTMGIIGYGQIGRRTAEIASAVGMEVLVHTRSTPVQGKNLPIQVVSLEQLLCSSDVVSLHCPLTEQTQELINERTLRLMKPGALLINTGRGQLINEDHLARFLNEGHIGGAGVDVLSQEPPKEGSPLIGAANCLITPHIAWATKESRRRLMDIAAGNVEAFLAGRPRNQVT